MPDPQPPRVRRSLPDLSKLYDTIEEPKVASLRDLAQTEPNLSPDLPGLSAGATAALPAKAGPALLRLPPELQVYLPVDLWRKLSGDTPRSGVLVNALDRLRSLLYTVSTYLPGDLVQEKSSRPIPGLVSGKLLKGCLLFSDVSGFTALSERLETLGPRGAEHMTEVINQYFSAMIEILAWSGGTLMKFAGDAALMYFPEQEGGAHVQWAVRTGLRMLRAMQQFSNLPTPLGPVALSMKVGLAAGPFLAASVGSASRMDYALVGTAVVQAMQAEGNAVAGQMVVNRLAADQLPAGYELTALKNDFFLLKPAGGDLLDEFEIRPEKRRARGAMPWSASPEEIIDQINEVLHQLQALTPYLASELVDRIVAHAHQRQMQSEYRPTTVMFCNFSGPEKLIELWGKAGVQRVTSLLSAYFNEMNDVITRFGGIVSRIDPYSRGTKLLALFGAPVAHEDDPQRAINAALAMNVALETLNRRWAPKMARHLPGGYPPALIEQRIGITLGNTFAGQVGSSTRREYTVMGDVVNLAARLMSAARPGQILVSDPVIRRVNDYYVIGRLPAVRLKGKSKPVPIGQVDGPRDDTLLNRIRSRPPLIGRDRELELCRQVLQRSAHGAFTILTLTGPGGIGKSHLADVLIREVLEQDRQALVYQCRSYQAEEAYACWRGLLRSLAQITSLDHPLIQKDKLERLTVPFNLTPAQSQALIDLLELRLAQFDPAAGPAQGALAEEDLYRAVREKKTRRRASRLEILDQLDKDDFRPSEENKSTQGRATVQRQQAIAALLASLAGRGPLVVFFEDAQWLDGPSRECLAELRNLLSAQPITFLLACRPQKDLEEWGERIQLNPFTPAETGALVASILTAGLAEIIHEQTNGSPLFVEEISHWIKRTHNLGEDEIRGVLQSSDILQKLVLSSIENLPIGQREVARLAAVLGGEFRRSEVEALAAGDIDPVTLSSHLHGLVQARLITLSEAGVDARYGFIQPVFREILYSSLSFERRRELHARAAAYLSTRPTRRRELRDKIAVFLDSAAVANPVLDAKILAYHYEMAEQWLPAACQWDAAAALLAPPQGEEFYSRASSLLDRLPANDLVPAARIEKARACLGLGDAALQRVDLTASTAAYENASAALAALPAPSAAEVPPVLAAGLAARLALLLPGQGKSGPGQNPIADLLSQRPEMDDWRLQALLAWLAWRADPEQVSVHVKNCKKYLETLPGGSPGGSALLDEWAGDWAHAAEAHQALAEVDAAALANVRLGDRYLRQENPIEAGARYDLAAALWQKPGAECGLALVQFRRAELAWQNQNPHRTLSLLEEALAILAKSLPAFQLGPRAAVQKALERVKSGQPGLWAAWQWQPFDDLIHIRLLLPLFPAG